MKDRPKHGNGVSPNPQEALSILDFRDLAERLLPASTWGYVSGGAGDEITLGWNRRSFDRIRLRPRVLVDAAPLSTGVELFGRRMPAPILLAPTGIHRAIHPEGELATARGAGLTGTTLVVSTPSTTAVEEIARVATGPLWFQLYVMRDRGFTRELIQRAEGAGCQAVCVTLDSPIQGARNRQRRSSFSLPEGLSQPHLEGMKPVRVDNPIFSDKKDPSFCWKDLDWLRSFTRVPILLKGVLDAADAERGVREGIDGIIVSNHGGRNLDTVPASVDALPEVAERVAGRVPVLMDGGIRRGTDVLKALGLGARAVLVGRPYVYGLAADGAEGVRRVIEILRTELEMAMVLTGKMTIDEIDAGVLW